MLLLDAQPVESVRRWMLGPFTTPAGMSVPAQGRIVCNCFGVAEADIRGRIDAGAGVEAIQAELRCGSSCGSCLPEIGRMARSARQAA